MKKINKNKEDENQDLDYNDPIYRENILDHYRNPRNFGELKTFSASFHAENTVCGDELNIELLIINEKIKDAKFIGKGCAVSMASVSMLIEKMVNICKCSEIVNMTLEVRESNIAAINLYKKFGFTEVKREITYHFWL